MDKPARTTDYLVMMEVRRRDLRERQTAILFSSSAGAPATSPDPDSLRPASSGPGSSPTLARFTWEIGCGHGHFLTAYAQAHPNEVCIGIDIVSERIGRATRKRDRAKLANLHFFHAEARLFLETLPVAATFSRLFVLFPDPWPKSRHRKNRILQPNFLAAAAARAGEGARLYFRTDYQPYFDNVRATLADHPSWLPAEEPWPFEHETVFQSRAKQYHSLIARLHAPSGH